MDRHRYLNPPITEAICQFNFSEPLPWTVVTPGIIYQSLQPNYPAEPERQEQLQATFGRADDKTPPEFQINRAADRVLYRDDSATRLLVLSPVNISVNSLPPYEGWPNLARRAKEAFQALRRASCYPTISTLSVRYINRIRLGFGNVDLSSYITIPIHAAPFDDATISAFFNRTESSLGAAVKVNVSYASLQQDPADEGAADVVLDIECFQNLDHATSVDDALAIVEHLKEIENDQFESVITDECRRLFK